MKILFLRGKVDERTERPVSIERSTDMWEHLAYHLSGEKDTCKVLYWNGDQLRYYNDRVSVSFVHDFKHLRLSSDPDVIFARGGFSEYEHITKACSNATTVWYGAGVRTIPPHHYDIILVDTEKDRKKAVARFPLAVVSTWTKPAAPCFKPQATNRAFDICYVANAQQAKLKRIKWVYETKPQHLTMLHLGCISKLRRPSNVMCVRANRGIMPGMYSQCKVGIIPYTAYDSAPRAYPEMVACGVSPVVCLSDTRITSAGPIRVATKETFWDVVCESVAKWIPKTAHPISTVEIEANHIRALIEEARGK